MSRAALLALSPSSTLLCTLTPLVYLVLAQGLTPPDIHSCLCNYLLIPCQDVFSADGVLRHMQPKKEKMLKSKEQKYEEDEELLHRCDRSKKQPQQKLL